MTLNMVERRLALEKSLSGKKFLFPNMQVSRKILIKQAASAACLDAVISFIKGHG